MMSKKSLGEILRELRKNSGMPLRKVGALLDIDVAILSKMERGERKMTKELVLRFAELYHQDQDELMVRFLSEKIYHEIGDEALAAEALRMADTEIAYRKSNSLSREDIIDHIREYMEDDNRILAAWLYGSFARGDMTDKSDIDLLVQFDPLQRITMFDFIEISHELERRTRKKIDLVEEGTLSPFAMKTAKKDFIKIYG